MLPFAVDPIATLRQAVPTRGSGNIWRPPQVAAYKFPTAVKDLDEGRIPFLEDTPVAWQIGNVKQASRKPR